MFSHNNLTLDEKWTAGINSINLLLIYNNNDYQLIIKHSNNIINEFINLNLAIDKSKAIINILFKNKQISYWKYNIKFII